MGICIPEDLSAISYCAHWDATRDGRVTILRRRGAAGLGQRDRSLQFGVARSHMAMRSGICCARSSWLGERLSPRPASFARHLNGDGVDD